MAKKKFSLNLWYCCSALLALAALVMIFMVSVRVVDAVLGVEWYTLNGLQAAFGYKDGNVEIFAFSFMNLLTLVFALAGLVLVVLKACGVAKSSLFDFVTMGLFLVAGVFFFLMPSFAVSNLGSAFVSKLGVGAILAGVLTLLAGCTLCVKALLKK